MNSETNKTILKMTTYSSILILITMFNFIYTTNNLNIVLLILFGFFINNVIKSLNQDLPILLLIITISLIKNDHMKISTIVMFYLSAFFQVLRLKKTKLYIKLRKVRIWSGPIFGCLLFWKIINKYGLLYMEIIALIIFLIGVYYRPDYSEGDYDENRQKHKYCMISSFTIVILEDLIYYRYLIN